MRFCWRAAGYPAGMSSPQKFTHDLLSPFLIDKRDAEVQLEDVDGLEDQLADKAAVSQCMNSLMWLVLSRLWPGSRL